MRAVFDSNIIIDLLNGISQADRQTKSYDVVISAVTYAEVLTGAIRRNTEAEVREFLRTMEIIPVDADIADLAAQVRIERNIKLPDAIIYATAKSMGLILLTRNSKDFSSDDVNIRIPYKL